jgi:hypothetical protein
MDQVELMEVKEEVVEEEEISLGEEQLQEEEVIAQEEDMMIKIKYEQDDGAATIEEHGNGPRREDQSDQQDEEGFLHIKFTKNYISPTLFVSEYVCENI